MFVELIIFFYLVFFERVIYRQKCKDYENKIYMKKELILLLGKVLGFINFFILQKKMFIYGYIILYQSWKELQMYFV